MYHVDKTWHDLWTRINQMWSSCWCCMCYQLQEITINRDRDHRVSSLHEGNWGCISGEVEMKFEFSAGLVVTKGDFTSVSPLLIIHCDEGPFQKCQLLPVTVAKLHNQLLFISDKCDIVFIIIFINVMTSLSSLSFTIWSFFVPNPFLCAQWEQFSCHFTKSTQTWIQLNTKSLVSGLFSWLTLSLTRYNNVLTILVVSNSLADQKLVVQFASKLTWEIELLISHGILHLNDHQKQPNVVSLQV